MTPPSGKKAFYIPTLAVIGVGLIGGSLARALKRGRHVGRVVGAGRSLASLQKARRLGVIDVMSASPAQAAQGADVVVVATPVGATEYILQEIAPALGETAVVTDVGSVKNMVCEMARDALGAAVRRFVPGHPVAGKEHSGVGASHAELFVGHRVALTPLRETDEDARKTVRRMWKAAGARVTTMPAAEHDRVLALTSHLPHVLAYAMVELFADTTRGGVLSGLGGVENTAPALYGDMAAGGFYDFTRTASSDPEMWRDICVTNRAQILRQLQAFSVRTERIAQLISDGDLHALERLFTAARDTRAKVGERRPARPRPTLLFPPKSAS